MFSLYFQHFVGAAAQRASRGGTRFERSAAERAAAEAGEDSVALQETPQQSQPPLQGESSPPPLLPVGLSSCEWNVLLCSGARQSEGYHQLVRERGDGQRERDDDAAHLRVGGDQRWLRQLRPGARVGARTAATSGVQCCYTCECQCDSCSVSDRQLSILCLQMPTPVIAPVRPAPRDDVIVSELRAKQCELEREVERLQRENEILECPSVRPSVCPSVCPV